MDGVKDWIPRYVRTINCIATIESIVVVRAATLGTRVVTLGIR